ncbi:MAG: trypsin-like peptidase domain-containing protein [Deltaproteobacteria bacterium]|nr:trypsin-like peptidase domain-containing protein [Deltaproteobacteria bacterium]
MGPRAILVCAALLCARTASAECTGAYAEDLSALSPRAREAERHAPRYVYAVRTTATYECVAYGAGGELRKTKSTQTAHGTAFGYRHDGGDTLLLTNEHVAEWPEVHEGCKRISDSLRIVDSDHDDYAADDIPLTRVVADQALDIAVLRAHTKLDILPWKIGASGKLTARTAVEVRGFPLGEFQAINVGKVISANEHDDYGDWDHDDFVVDALLTSGGSGSPVLAVSCKTGELELVGIFHAHYNAASALNVVVSIDQLRTLMKTLQVPKRAPGEPLIVLDAAARSKLVDAIRGSIDPPYFPLGPLVATANVRGDGTLVWAIFPSDFPRATRPLLVVEDVGGEEGFGSVGRVLVGLRPYPDRDADAQALLLRTLDALRRDAIVALDMRAAPTPASRDAFERAARRRKAYDRMIDGQRELAGALDELAARVHPQTTPIALSQLLH